MQEFITDTNIVKLRELAHKDSVNECVSWIIDHYAMEIEELKNKYLDWRNRTVILIQENEELENKNSNLRESNKTCSAEIDELKNEIAERDEANMDLREENQKYKRVFEKGGCSALLSNVELYRSRNNVLAEENKELKAKLEYEKELNANCRTQYIELENELERIKKQNTEVGDISESLEVENDKLKAKIETLLNNETGASCSIPKSIIVENQELNFENRKLKSRIADLEEYDGSLNIPMLLMNTQAQRENRIHCFSEKLKEVFDEGESAVQANEELKKEIEDYKCAYVTLNDMHVEVCEKNEELKRKLKKIKRIIK